jgi:hypothetical protein
MTYMKDVVRFRWEGYQEHEAGFAFYEFGTSSYTMEFQSLRSAIMVRVALLEAYQAGYDDGVRRAEHEVQRALSKLLK